MRKHRRPENRERTRGVCAEIRRTGGLGAGGEHRWHFCLGEILSEARRRSSHSAGWQRSGGHCNLKAQTPTWKRLHYLLESYTIVGTLFR